MLSNKRSTTVGSPRVATRKSPRTARKAEPSPNYINNNNKKKFVLIPETTKKKYLSNEHLQSTDTAAEQLSRASLMVHWVKNLPAMQGTQEMQVQSLGQEDPLEKEIATHSSILAWEIPWTEKPGRQLSKGSQRVRHN